MPVWLTEGVLVALVGLAGAIIGHITGGVTQYKTARLSTLESDLERLTGRVEKLEHERDDAVEAMRSAERLMWHVVEHLRRVLSWARDVTGLVPEGTVVPPEPEPPEPIRDIL